MKAKNLLIVFAKRKLNKKILSHDVILYRIPESDEVLAVDRNKQDNSICEHFFNSFNVGFDKDDISRVHRLGKRNENFPRPILVQLGLD